MKPPIAVQDTYPEDFSHCYGCGRLNPAGHQIKTYAGEAGTVTDFEPAPAHTGGLEFAYGGVIASVIDCHSTGSAAIFWMQREGLSVGKDPAARFVTARLEVDYLAPTPLVPLRLRGAAAEIADRKVVVTTELVAGDQVTARGRAVLVRVTETAD
jgi:acyl-coenzyme A thioesterase PaaI-like protein